MLNRLSSRQSTGTSHSIACISLAGSHGRVDCQDACHDCMEMQWKQARGRVDISHYDKRSLRIY